MVLKGTGRRRRRIVRGRGIGALLPILAKLGAKALPYALKAGGAAALGAAGAGGSLALTKILGDGRRRRKRRHRVIHGGFYFPMDKKMKKVRGKKKLYGIYGKGLLDDAIAKFSAGQKKFWLG